jgi:hypothetical protein
MAFADMDAAMTAMLTHFKTAWDAQTPPVPPVAWEDTDTDIPEDTDTEWAEVLILHDKAGQSTLGEVGSRTFSKPGHILVRIRTKPGQGRSRSNALVQNAINAFEGTATTADGVWFRDVSSQEVGNIDGWYQVNVVARFTYDVVK